MFFGTERTLSNKINSGVCKHKGKGQGDKREEGKAGLANKNTRVLCASWRSVKKRVKSASSSDDEKIRVEMCVCAEGDTLCVRVCERVCLV